MAPQKSKPRPGDATGVNKAKLEAEHAEEIAARAAELGMVSHAKAEATVDGVFDPESGAQVDPETGEPLPEDENTGTPVLVDEPEVVDLTGDAEPAPAPVFAAPGEDDEDEVIDLAEDDDEPDVVVPEPEPQRRRIFGGGAPAPQIIDAGVEVADSPTVVIRVNTTLEQVTIGAGNHYDFEEGKQYRVPRHVAEYLDGMGYVWGGQYRSR